MIANTEKFETILIKTDHADTSDIEISLDGTNITSENTVKVLGLNLDNKLNFDRYIDLCKKAAYQLNVINRLKHLFNRKVTEKFRQNLCARLLLKSSLY